MDKKRIQQVVFGSALGVGIGLLFDSLILLGTSAWLTVFIIPVLAPVILAAIIFGNLGRKGKLPIASWFFTCLIIIIIWPLCLFGPIWIREGGLRARFNQEVPIYAGSKIQSSSIEAFRSDTYPHVTVNFKAEVNYLDAIDFFRSELSDKGWKITLDNKQVVYSHSGQQDGWSICAKKPKQSISITIQDSNIKETGLREDFTLIKVYYETKDILLF
jgi:hypothetical protein